MRPRLAQWHQSGATDGQVPVWDNDLMMWVPGDAGGALTLDDLTDVDTTSVAPTDGQTLIFDTGSGLWAPGDAPAAANGIPTGGTDGQVLTKLSGTDYDVDWETPAAGGGGGGSPLVHASRVSGNVTVSSTSFAAVDSGLDLTVAASAGDILHLSTGFLWGNQASVVGEARFVTRAGGANVNNIPNTTSGIGSLACQISGQYVPVAAVVGYTVQAGDVSGGNVIIRLEARVNTSSRVIWANGNYGLFVTARNTSA